MVPNEGGGTLQHLNTNMIYLIDQLLTENSHSRYMLDIIRQHTDAPVQVVEIDSEITTAALKNQVKLLPSKVFPHDIVLCPWSVPKDEELDFLFEVLTDCCWVVAAAGNFKEPIENYTPARTQGVITVGTLNKEGLIAALSNYSTTKEIIWVPGTNYDVGWKNGSGTSVSSALYAAFLSQAMKTRNMNLVQELIQKQKDKVFGELHPIV